MIRLNCDEEFFDMMEGFILSKTHELKLANEENNDSESTRPIAESQPVVANPFVTKRRGRPPNRLKNALEDITGTHHNVLGSTKAVLEGSNIQERKKNKCTNCG
ncbi:16604_t:CDS:1, partial [Dentiscutata heterogama]